MQEGPAEGKPLRHAAGVRRDPVVARLPQGEALEEHADPLASLRHAVEAPEQIEVLDGGELAVHERLVAEVAELRTIDADDELPTRRGSEAREHPQQRRLAASVRPRDGDESALGHGDVHGMEDALAPVPLLEAAAADHATRTSSATNTKNTTLITPFSVKNAASRRWRSPGRTIACS